MVYMHGAWGRGSRVYVLEAWGRGEGVKGVCA